MSRIKGKKLDVCSVELPVKEACCAELNACIAVSVLKFLLFARGQLPEFYDDMLSKHIKEAENDSIVSRIRKRPCREHRLQKKFIESAESLFKSLTAKKIAGTCTTMLVLFGPSSAPHEAWEFVFPSSSCIETSQEVFMEEISENWRAEIRRILRELMLRSQGMSSTAEQCCKIHVLLNGDGFLAAEEDFIVRNEWKMRMTKGIHTTILMVNGENRRNIHSSWLQSKYMLRGLVRKPSSTK